MGKGCEVMDFLFTNDADWVNLSSTGIEMTKAPQVQRLSL